MAEPHLLVHDGLPIMAAGLPAMAAHLGDHGFPCEVRSLYAERRAGLHEPLLHGDLLLVGLSAHWFDQLPSALATAQRLRADGFDGVIVLGGFTASLFAAELLRGHPAIDAVIRGDGEQPLLELARQLDQPDSDLGAVPNLAWRTADGAVATAPISYVGARSSVDALSFGRLDTIRHLPRHLAASSWRAITDGSPGFGGDLERTFYLCGGRGCSVDCATCGGGRAAQQLHSGRSDICWRSPARNADDVQQAMDLGCTSIHACFDPDPNGPHWHAVMDQLQARRLRPAMVFESFAVPDDEFLDHFAATFDGGIVVLSPETAHEAIRLRTRGFAITDADLDRALARIVDLGLHAQVFLGWFTPFEDLAALRRTRAWARELPGRFGPQVEVFHFPYSTDPGSPLARNPARWGMRCSLASATDYLDGLRDLDPWMDNLLGHEPALGEPGGWRAVGLGLELERACRQQRPGLYADITRRAGDRVDAFFLRLARRLLQRLPAADLRRDRLAEAVVRAAEEAP